MNKIAKYKIEQYAIELFERLNYSFSQPPNIANDVDKPER